MADPQGKVVFSQVYEKLETEARGMFGGTSNEEGRYGNDDVSGMDIMEMFNDMPPVSVLLFQQNAWDENPEDIVADLLRKVHSLDI